MIDYGSPRGGALWSFLGPWGQGVVLGLVLGKSGNNMSMRWGIMPIYHVCHMTLAQNISVLRPHFSSNTLSIFEEGI